MNLIWICYFDATNLVFTLKFKSEGLNLKCVDNFTICENTASYVKFDM